MAYGVFFTKYALRLLKKLTPAIQSLVGKEIESIARNPYVAYQLKGGAIILRSWHVYLKGVPYRIIFEIQENSKSILMHIIAKRPDAYRLLERLYR